MTKAMTITRMPLEFMHLFTAALLSTMVVLCIIWPMGMTIYALDLTGLIEVQWKALFLSITFSAAYQAATLPFFRPQMSDDTTIVFAGLKLAMIMMAVTVIGAAFGAVIKAGYALYLFLV